MMGIYIKGMEMPKRCWDCLLSTYGYCMASEHGNIIPADAPIPDWCPIIPVPPHGRLGDLDKLADSFEPSDFWNHDAQDNCYAAVHIVHSAPTVIPASEEGE